MLENSSVELKTLVLLEFTKRLIISKNPMGFFLVKQELPKTKKEEFVEKIKRTGNFHLFSEDVERKRTGNFQLFSDNVKRDRKISAQRIVMPAPILKIPETRLPPQFAYLRPYATNEIDLDLGELNP
ncbi:MAG: hypothetical protein AABX44_02080, partial [Nanoarchaeota archaeon]